MIPQRLLSWICLLIVAVLGSAGLGSAAAQDVALADRAPRFLYASTPGSVPQPVDVDRTPTLRQKVSLALENATLADALAEVSRQTGLRFVYSKDVLRAEARVALHAQQITVAAALTEILLGERVDVLFSSARQAALVKRRSAAVAIPADTGATVAGRVTAKETGAAIGGAGCTLLVALAGGLAGCSGLDPVATYEQLTDPAQLFMALTLDHPAVNLSTDATVPSYNTLQLTATPRNALGRPLTGLPAPTFHLDKATDSTKVTVTPTGLVTAKSATTGNGVHRARRTRDRRQRAPGGYGGRAGDDHRATTGADQLRPRPRAA